MALIYTNPYRQPYEAARQETQRLTQEREALQARLAWIDQRIAHLAATMQALALLLESSDSIDLGLTAACRHILMAAGRPMTAQEVRHQLAVAGIDLANYSNPMAVLHTVLRRIARPERRGPVTVYVWRTELPPVPGTTPSPSGWET